MYEYKCVGAPERARRSRGARTRSARVALALQEIIDEEAVDGWEYLRTDVVPVEEKAGLFSRAREIHRAVLVFRRSRVAAHAPAAPVAPGPDIAADAEPIRLAAERPDGSGREVPPVDIERPRSRRGDL